MGDSKNLTTEEVLLQLANFYYDRAKSWAGRHFVIEVAVYGAGVGAVFFHSLPVEYPVVSLLLLLLTGWVAARVESCKDIAEKLKRQHEFWEGWGEHLSPNQLANLRVKTGKTLPPDVDALLQQGSKFSSSRPPGPGRALENLIESSWYSGHLAAWCAEILRVIFVITLLAAMIVLLIVASSIQSHTISTIAAKLVSSTLACVISVGMLKSWLAFARFSRESFEIEAEASRMLKSTSEPTMEVLRLLTDYQMLRSGSPLIPTWVWKLRRGALNENWEVFKQPSFGKV